MSPIEQRLSAVEAALASNTSKLDEIHLAVVGDGSRGSSLRERVATLESSNNFGHRALYSILPSVVTALLAQIGLHLPPHTS